MSKTKITRLIMMIFLVLPSVVFGASASASLDNQLNIVALGDSYTAGNGALVYEDHSCWRSGNAYVHQYAKRLRDAGYSVKAENFACMSAVNVDIVQQLHVAKESVKDADMIFLTIGGNDAKFTDIVIWCFAAEQIVEWNGVTLSGPCRDKLNDANTNMSAIATDTKNNLRIIRALNPDAKIVLVGYPYLIAEGCEAVKSADRVRSVQKSSDGFYEAIVGNLNNEFGGDSFVYVSLLDAFAGGEVCGNGQKLIRGFVDTFPVNFTKLLDGDLLGVGDEIVAEWWHPNVEGHAKISDEIVSLRIQPNFVREVIKPDDPIYTTPSPASGADGYGNLPFDCGTVVPYVSTYGTFSGVDHGSALDMPMPRGTSVVSVANGVAYVRNDPEGYGKHVDVHGDDGYIYRMAHLESDVQVVSGQAVKRGQIIGQVGSTGFVTGPHLHFEQRTFSTGMVEINLGGPALDWGVAADYTGYRQTTHSLLSQNCSGTTLAASSRVAGDKFEDIMVYEFGNIRYGRSDGYDYRNWEVALPNITDPHTAVACDFDGDGWDEYLSYEQQKSNPSWVVMADPKGDGKFNWRRIATVHTVTDIITCGDWTGDGKDDLLIHNTRGEIIVGRSNGTKVDRWIIALKGIGTQTYWTMCDINGDGRDDLVTYEAWGNQIMVGTRRSDLSMKWRRLLGGIHDVGGLTCGNFTSYARDEIVVWQPEQNGRYVVGRFTSRFALHNWDPMSPVGLARPYKGELVSGDIDGDGYDEFVANEFRSERGDHSVMIGDFNSPSNFSWHPFIEGVSPRDLVVGNFIG